MEKERRRQKTHDPAEAAVVGPAVVHLAEHGVLDTVPHEMLRVSTIRPGAAPARQEQMYMTPSTVTLARGPLRPRPGAGVGVGALDTTLARPSAFSFSLLSEGSRRGCLL